MASAASSDLFDSWPERVQRLQVQRLQSQVSGPSSCELAKLCVQMTQEDRV